MSEIIYISVQPENQDEVYRSFTADYLRTADPEEIGLKVQEMFESIDKE